MKIPAACPSLFETCSIIRNNYELKIEMEASGLSKAKHFSIPIVIGTEPFVMEGDTDAMSLVHFRWKESLIKKFKKIIE